MYRKFGFLLLVLASAAASLAQTRMISHVTRVGGGFTTTVQIENQSVVAKSVTLKPFDSSGNALAEKELTIPGQGVQAMATTEMFVDGDSVSHFQIDGGDEVVVSVFYDFAGDGSPAHVRSTDSQANTWRIFPGDWEHVFDGLAVVNMGSAAADVTIIQKDYAGNVLSTETLVSGLSANAKALYVIGSPNGSSFNLETASYFEVNADQPLVITALRGTLASAAIGLLWANEALIL